MPGRRRLPRSAPELQGVDPRALLALVDALVAVPELHSLMVVRHGHVVAEGWAPPYAPDRLHLLYSLSKAVTATAVGLAQADGLLAVDDLLVDHVADALPDDPADHLATMRLRDLLTMRTGHHDDPSDRVFGEPDWLRAFLALPVEHPPGTHFVYNTAATYVLAAVVERRAGVGLLEYLGPRLLEPLGIEDATWEVSPQGHVTGGFGLSLTTEDVAVLGQLLLQDGVWQDRRLLPEGWVAEASRSHVPAGPDPANDWGQGYGYQLWRSRHGYRGDGAFGQFCLVLPEHDLVVALTSGTSTMARQLAAVWDHLLPGLADAPLPDDEGARADLEERLAALDLPVPVGAPAGAPVHGRTLLLEPNRFGLTAARLDDDGGQDLLTLRRGDETLTVPVGRGMAARSHVRLEKPFDEELLAAGAWPEPAVYELELRLPLTPHAVRVRATVDGDDVRVEGALNAYFDEDLSVRLTGRLTG
ncbi:serine hydrolase domain-containing protein [Cellulomonas massiliensis]|uniref:serine hydrolase domain-containing protein n=1 Tax=Cellulomonas massiliensis TaxID=1465811 RepID=UPI00031520E1|nr:serine hydrolase [Cellulomonas massiliensis]